MRYLPFALTTLRLVLAPATLVCALERAPRWIYLPILVIGTLSDIFDGILARRLGVATQSLRRYDSATDIVYYLLILAAVWIARRPLILASWIAIALILVSEAGVLAVSLFRFRKYPATHSYLAKFYGLCLLAAVIGLLVFNFSGWLIVSLVVVAFATNFEIIAIHLLVDSPPVDVRSIFAALAQRN